MGSPVSLAPGLAGTIGGLITPHHLSQDRDVVPDGTPETADFDASM
jgi:hypothetical protein